MGYVDGYWRKDGTYVRGHERRGANDGDDGAVLGCLLILALVVLPFVGSFYFVRAVHRSPRWNHAVRAAVVTVVCAFSLLGVAWFSNSLTEDQQQLSADQAFISQVGYAYGIADDQDAVDTDRNLLGVFESVAVTTGAWAAVEWIVVVHRDSRRRQAVIEAKRVIRDLDRAATTAQQTLEANARPWRQAQADLKTAAFRIFPRQNTVPSQADRAAFMQAMRVYSRAAAAQLNLVDARYDARMAFLNARHTANPAVDDRQQTEQVWQTIRATRGRAEATFETVKQQFDTHGAIRAAVPHAYSPDTWAGICAEYGNACEQLRTMHAQYEKASDQR